MTNSDAESENDTNDTYQAVVDRIRGDLCEGWIDQPVPSWGPAPKDPGTNSIQSWTETISHEVGSVRHYITCDGFFAGTACLGRWSRRRRDLLSPGKYCIFDSWIDFDGTKISDCNAGSSERRTLGRLRNIWARHIQQPAASENAVPSATRPLLSEEEVQTMYTMLSKAIEKSMARKPATVDHKTLGKGDGGWDGVVENTIVMKRDTGSRMLGNGTDRCDQEPGHHFRTGDLEVWATWNGWSGMATRDGRFRPGYHLELMLCLLTAVVDYGANREVWRGRNTP
ncbi:hypothetical protein N7494_001875 [Penicillium frequentans]|uniref:Uncharacterized protein n=1 Tax=Penicillium frequentans TaxID=3151616 RepID=A0AAD6D2J5_9EURO|nr:hypothetical protein N7494_001875 [Penicillium glabrum]